MVRFERRDTAKARRAIQSLELEKQKKSGTYRTPQVYDALQEQFYHKCYLCEQKKFPGGYQIEHLHPYKGNIDLEFDWNNLYLACVHCNNTKLGKYDPILDCCQEDIDQKIAFSQKDVFEQCAVKLTPLEDGTETKNTVALLNDIYEGTTPSKRIEAQNLRRELKKELDMFAMLLYDYKTEDNDDEKEEYRYCIRQHLKPSSPFTAFKRWMILNHQDQYPEFLPYIYTE